MSVLCLGEVWLELNAATAPELTETFRAQTGGWGAGWVAAFAKGVPHCVQNAIESLSILPHLGHCFIVISSASVFFTVALF